VTAVGCSSDIEWNVSESWMEAKKQHRLLLSIDLLAAFLKNENWNGFEALENAACSK
jgi:hypothetical protein